MSACLLSACWIHPLGSWSVPLLKCVYMCLLNWSVVFLYFLQPMLITALGWWSMCSPLFSLSWTCLSSFSPQSGDSSQWSRCLPGSDQYLILGPCSCSFLSNYMVVISGKILWGISYACAHVSWVTRDYQVSSKFLLGTLPSAFDVMVPIRESKRETKKAHHMWVQALWAEASRHTRACTPAEPTECAVSGRFSFLLTSPEKERTVEWLLIWLDVMVRKHNTRPPGPESPGLGLRNLCLEQAHWWSWFGRHWCTLAILTPPGLVGHWHHQWLFGSSLCLLSGSRRPVLPSCVDHLAQGALICDIYLSSSLLCKGYCK